MSYYFQTREWMDRHIDPIQNSVSREFMEGVQVFISFASNQDSFKELKTMLCPCARCQNRKQCDAKTVSHHLFRVGFKGNYYVWSSHGENLYEAGESSRAPQSRRRSSYAVEEPYQENVNVDIGGDSGPAHIFENVMEEENEEQYENSVFEAFAAANQPLYDGCVEGISQLHLASCIMKVKTDYNLPESCLDEISQIIKIVLPQPNKAPASYKETKKLTRSLGLPVVKIDICEDNCMLFWKEDQELLACRFCGKDRYHQIHGDGKRSPKKGCFICQSRSG